MVGKSDDPDLFPVFLSGVEILHGDYGAHLVRTFQAQKRIFHAFSSHGIRTDGSPSIPLFYNKKAA